MKKKKTSSKKHVQIRRKTRSVQKTLDQKRLWFRAKTHGWGWVPATWEGWLVTIFFLFMLVPAVQSIVEASMAATTSEELLYATFFYILFILVDISVLIMICFKTGEKPHWRWGK